MSGSSPLVGSSSTSRSASHHERGDQRDLLPVALRVLPTLLRRVELEALAQLVATAGVVAAVHRAEQVEHLAAAQRRPRRELAGHERQAPVRLLALGPRVEAEDPGRARARPGQAEHRPDRRGLARAVRAEEAVDLAGSTVIVRSSSAVNEPNRLVRPCVSIGAPPPARCAHPGTVRGRWRHRRRAQTTTSAGGVRKAWMNPAIEARNSTRATAKATSAACCGPLTEDAEAVRGQQQAPQRLAAEQGLDLGVERRGLGGRGRRRWRRRLGRRGRPWPQPPARRCWSASRSCRR